MKIIKNFPILFARNKNGVFKQWMISVMEDDHGDIVVETCHGQKDGKMIRDVRRIDKLNKKYSDLMEQAIQFAESRWNHKRDRERYFIDINDEKIMIAPMLCKTFDAGKHLIFPVYVQPKIDGIRCLAQFVDGTVELRSRTGLLFRSSHIKTICEKLSYYLREHPNHVLDGELYSDEIPFEELSGLCRLSDNKQNITMNIKIRYCIFDIILMDEMSTGFQSRMSHLLLPDDDIIKTIQTIQATSIDEIMHHHEQFVRDGYEGIIIRNQDGLYRMGYRSWDLQKYKTFKEEEFKIVGFDEGSGRDKNTIIWICETPDKKQFRVRPRGSIEYRTNLFKNASHCIGNMATVIFQEYSTDGIPRFPVGKSIRKYC